MTPKLATEPKDRTRAHLANVVVEPVIDSVRYPIAAYTIREEVTVWPAVSAEIGIDRVIRRVSIDLTTWFVTYAGDQDTVGVTLPVACPDQDAAISLAGAFVEHHKQGYADPHDLPGLLDWCTWWASEHPQIDVRPPGVMIE
ncbi:hypothetical protein DL991_40965 [Amycolatopsis sp. WAC 01375]|uniref:hypothetical protein n=1 Tax=Amycolatopsis sp. WAC 01375 TaxID=2203194 RepID=UPI000F785A23|nr:hypothetical protein [Amycolatopsis sp. WAC 01375]RSM68949.1 hypothetical protein DL991_40965 [Amycolatopsis sp. WAC 01375]